MSVKQLIWKVLIADDEPAARRGVFQLLEAFPEFTVTATCRNGVEVLKAIDTTTPDVLFLDIQMPGIDGFEVIRRSKRENMPEIVFLTAYGQYALDAFEVEAVDYLVKPVSRLRFSATIARLKKRLRSRSTSQPNKETITATTPRGLVVIDVDDINWIESAGNYSRVWTGARGYLVRESLHSLAGRFRERGFLPAHRSALVRLNNVRELTLDLNGGLVAVLKSDVRVQVSRRRRAAFVAALRSQKS